MKIKSVEALAIDMGFQKQALQTQRIASPMCRWPEFADQRAAWMWPNRKTFVRIEDEDGIVGWSCTNGGEVTELIVSRHLARIVVGNDTNDIADLWDRMFFSLLPNDRSGFAMMAIAGVDIALWDLKAKQNATSLMALLGGRRSKAMPAYVTTSDLGTHSGKPWWGLKAAMPFGRDDGDGGLRKNIELMQSFRDAAGPNRHIMLDAFMAWDADYTIRFAEKAEDLDLYWIEDPLPPYDLDGLAQIKAAVGSRTKMALGNFCFNRWDCAQLIDAELVDILQPDVAWAGGITETLRILEMADAAGVPVILHNTSEQPWALALAASRQHSPVVEFVDRGPNSNLYNTMGAAPRIADGVISVETSETCNTPPASVVSDFQSHARNLASVS